MRPVIWLSIAISLLLLGGLLFAASPYFLYLSIGLAAIPLWKVFGSLGLLRPSSTKKTRDWVKERPWKTQTVSVKPIKGSNSKRWTIAVAIGLFSSILIGLIVGGMYLVGISEEFFEGVTTNLLSDTPALQGDYYMDQGQYDSAKVSYQRAIAIAPESAAGYTGMGNWHLRFEAYDSAISFYNQALRLEEGNYAATYGKAYACYLIGEYATAIGLLEKQMGEGDYDEPSVSLLGWCYFSRENTAKAFEIFSEAYEDGFEGFDILYGLARLYEVKNDKENAIKFYEEALAYLPNHKDTQDRLRKLKTER